MIFKLIFTNKTEFAEASDIVDLINQYDIEYDDDVLNILKVEVIDDEVAKIIMLKSNEPDLISEISLFDTCDNDGFFKIVGYSEWDS